MNYSAMIQNRKSVREFMDREISANCLEVISNYYDSSVRRLIPGIETKLYVFGTGAREALEGSAGYNNFLVGAPQYLVLLSEKHPLAALNAGYMMEDMILNLVDIGLDSCWMTFADSDSVKNALGIDSDLNVAAIAAFGYGKKTVKRLRLNMRSMSNVDIAAKHRYMDPKKSVNQLAFLNTWGNTRNLNDYIGFFDDVLWEALYAVSQAPSYLNRQAYGFILRDGAIHLVRCEDAYTTEADGNLSLGIALLHFDAVAENWTGKVYWSFGSDVPGLELPEGYRLTASAYL